MQATTPKDNSFFSREKEELPRAGLESSVTCIHVTDDSYNTGFAYTGRMVNGRIARAAS